LLPENINDAVVAVKLNLLIIAILVKIRLVKMAIIVYVNAVVIRKNEVGQKWIIILKENVHSAGKKKT